MRLPLLLFFIPVIALSNKLTIYTYDSFSGKGSLGEKAKQVFEKASGSTIDIVPFGSAGEAINQVILEKEKCRADLVLGVDNGLLPRARTSGLFGSFDPAIKQLPDKVVAEADWIPFDYGYLAFVYDESRFKPKPGTSLKNLAEDSRLKKKIALPDPRTSSIGRLFLLWTIAEFGETGFDDFWKSFSNLVLAIAPGWSGAYALFNQKEADLVLSYTTSPAYHLEFEKTDRVNAIRFPAHMQQVEGVMLLRSSKNRTLAQKYVENLLSKEIQSQVPLTNFMYPVLSGIELPRSFRSLPPEPRPVKLLSTGDDSSWIRRWVRAVK